ncbi:MFS transporter [Nisaea acidiphila]|uniref:MFS transporter n=1 Tax=Nisaea acidiphila TaxID=1862145 RepID=A0A9J7AP78_9PROT|nr:MFS transporter [Nisaea acidiphila]UUX48722.1 MFS transporter [Nisaea acidiphila]
MTAPDERTRWDIVTLAVGAGVIAALQVGKVPPALPELRTDLGLTLVGGGWLASLLHLFAALFAIGMSMATDRVGPARLLVVSMLVMAAGSALGALSGSTALLFAGRALESLGFLGASISAPTLIVAAAVPRDRSLALGIWSAYFPVGAAIAMVAAPIFLNGPGWRGLWLADAAICLAVAVLLAILVRPAHWPDVPGPRRGRGLRDVAETLRLPGPYLFALSFFLYACAIFALMTWMPTFLLERLGYSLESAALIGALVVLVNVVGNLGAAWLMHRNVPRWSIIAISFLGVLGTAWFVFAGTAPDALRVPAAVAMSCICGVLPAACLSGAPAHARSSAEVATCSGVVVHGSNLGNLLAAPIFATVVTYFGGWSNGHLPMIGLGIAGLAVTVLVRAVDRER